MKENNNLSLSDLSESTILRENKSLLSLLLKDHTNGKNIKWGTNSYINHGYSFRDDQEIKIDLITGWYEGFIRPRVDKDIDTQLERQRNRAEVFTPSWVIKLQVDAALKDMEELSLVDFIKTKWLEITCGEAPYMVNRYDMETGEVIPLKDRSGFIDVKFKKLNQEIEPEEEEWLKLAVEIYKASYGYEYQGDSLLLARENLILTFIDNYFYMFGAFPKEKILLEITKIISLNVFQMDGLTYEVPYSDGGAEEFGTQLSLFEDIEVEEKLIPKRAKIKLWDKNKLTEFKSLLERKEVDMKFDVVIGNPPYQEEASGTSTSDDPIYHFFMEESYMIADKVVLITPARFLFNAGKTPKSFNRNMLNSEHIKVKTYIQKSSDIFPNTDIKGGVAITYFDKSQKFGKIGTFTSYPELNNIRKKVTQHTPFKDIREIIENQNKFDLENLYRDYPEYKSIIGSNGKDKRLRQIIMERLSDIFSEAKPREKSCKILGLINKKRVWRYIAKEYVDQQHENLHSYKVLVPSANGSPAIGEAANTPVIGKPLIAKPLEGYTQTFIGIGAFDTKTEAEAALKYIKTKFARAMLGILKVTQGNNKSTWANVPLQNFKSSSDIDWTTSISEIDQQLYEKYNLNNEEINFIEKNVKEME